MKAGKTAGVSSEYFGKPKIYFKRRTIMQNVVKSAVITEPQKFTKRIGSTTYVVSVHFNESSKETLNDKILRLIEREVRNAA